MAGDELIADLPILHQTLLPERQHYQLKRVSTVAAGLITGDQLDYGILFQLHLPKLKNDISTLEFQGLSQSMTHILIVFVFLE